MNLLTFIAGTVLLALAIAGLERALGWIEVQGKRYAARRDFGPGADVEIQLSDWESGAKR